MELRYRYTLVIGTTGPLFTSSKYFLMFCGLQFMELGRRRWRPNWLEMVKL